MTGGFDPMSYVLGQRSIDPNAEYYTKAQIDVLLAQKQNTLTFDDTPTDGSTNPVTSDGIYEAVNDVVKFATGTITAGSLTTTINFSGTLVYAFAVLSGSEILVNKTVNAGSIVFTLNEVLTNTVNCFVIYV